MHNAVVEALVRREQNQGRVSYEYRIYDFGGVSARVQWESRWPIEPKLEMIAHRKFGGATASATIEIIAGDHHDIKDLLPEPRRRNTRVLFSSDKIYYFWSPDGAGSLTIFDRVSRRGIVWYLSLDTVTSWETSKPLLQTVKALSLDAEWVPVHAAAAAWNNKGLLFTGPSGIGKSSTVLACVDAGWKYIGDDFLILRGKPVQAKNIFASARIREDMFSRLSRTVSFADYLSTDSGETKAEVNMSKLPDIDIGDARLHAILIPRRSQSKETTIVSTKRSTALRALAATTLVNLPGAPAETHKKIENFVEDLPCYSLSLGTEFSETAHTLARWIESL